MTQPTFAFPTGLSEKYKPQTIAQFIGLDKPRKVLSTFCVNPHPSAWLFVGPSGTGKTTMALAIADQLRAEVHHIASQKCTVDTVEDTIRLCHRAPWNFFGQHAGKSANFHVVLIDEADAMTNAAQLAFLSKLDATAYPPTTIFIFTCNATDRLEARFLSRCRVLEFSSYGMRAELAKLLAHVWKAETGRDNGIDFERLAKDCNNNVRDALMSLEVEILAQGS